jgi:hypothetical protein
MGPWFFIGEATREVAQGETIAVLDLDLDSEAGMIPEAVVVADLRFRSLSESELDARRLPPRVVSEAARDVLGAVAASRIPVTRVR